MDEKLMQKLLALAGSDNENEASVAIAKAQKMVWVANTEGEGDILVPDDFNPLLVVEGDHRDLTPERWR